jgi:competence protein ComEC
VAIPLVSGLITPLVLLLSLWALVVPGLAAWMAPGLVGPTALLMRALDALGGLPFSSWTIAHPDSVSLILSGLAVAMLLRPHPLPARPLWAFALIPLLVGGATPVSERGLRAHALDVGQGMAVLVETRGYRVLYDAGPFWSADSNAGQRVVVPWLRARGIRRIDLLVISHPDLDHVGGVHDLLRQIEVGAVLSALPPGHPFRVDHPNHQPCRRGHQWQINGAHFEILHPGQDMPPGAARSPTNARSCVLRVSTPSGAILLPGDLEARQERDLIDRLGAAALAADILVAPHHGSNTSSTEAWIAAVAPRWALVQAGYRNRFGHPTAKVLARYEQAGVKVLRTDRDGAITIELGPADSPRILSSRVDQPPYWRLP